MKDLFDAVKEAYTQTEPMPEAGGWQKVSASMHRASVVRTLAWAGGAVAACAACALLFVHVPDSNFEVVPAAPAVATVSQPEPVEALPEEEGFTLAPEVENFVAQTVVKNVVHAKNEASSSTASDYADAEPENADPVVPFVVESEELTEYQDVSDTSEKITEKRTIEDALPENWWEYDPAPQKKQRHVTFGINASTSPVSSMASNVLIPQMDFLAVLKSNNFANNHTASEMKSLYSNFSSAPTSISYIHDLPVGLGLAVGFPLSERFSFETGLNYTYLHSVEDNAGTLSDQRLHFAGIPLRMNVVLARGRNFSLYTGAGFSAEKCLKATLGSRSYDENRLQLSGEVFAGVEYKLWKSTSVYIQPALSYWFTETDLITYRTENPLVFSLNAGIRFHL
ncbi:MAG: outer membrane beta-barrel protein [Bacteroidia bacterium]|nr:outer membrane beta-barrel protein [Bacteroidia bacterium]